MNGGDFDFDGDDGEGDDGDDGVVAVEFPSSSRDEDGGSAVVQIIDVDALSTAVSRLCESDVYKFHGRIEVKGKHGRTLRNWLANDLGF